MPIGKVERSSGPCTVRRTADNDPMNSLTCQAKRCPGFSSHSFTSRTVDPRISRWRRFRPLVLGLILLGQGIAPRAHAAAGDLDGSFVPSDFSANSAVTLAVTPSGRVLVGGDLTAVRGPGDTLTGLIQLNSTGALDPHFGVPETVAQASAVSVGSGGDIVCAGLQNNGLNAVVRRLFPDGTLDASLDLELGGTTSPWVYALARQADQRLLVAGVFNRVGSVPRTNLFRVHSDGSLDATFKTNFTSGGAILALALSSDQRPVIGGYFTTVQGVARKGIARLNTDGTLDTTFNPGSGVQGMVSAIAVQADGRILIGGHFFSVNGALRSGLARLLPSGALDTSFDIGPGAWLSDKDPLADHPSVEAIVLQGDGRIVIGGHFSRFGGVPRAHLARLHWQGEVDDSFDPGLGPNLPVRGLALDASGFLLIAGDFTSVSGTACERVARLASDGTLPVLPSIVIPPADVSVTLGQSATFTVAAVGTPALRFQWLKSGLPMAGQTNATLVLAQAQLADAGRYSVSVANPAGAVTSSTAQLTVQPAPVAPVITADPESQMVQEGTPVALTAVATGSKPLAWQWRQGTTPVTWGTSSTLFFDAITLSQAGAYTARVTNSAGSATSDAAALVVYRPPSGRTTWATSNVTFQVEVAGPGPFTYQWHFNGAPLAGAVKATLTLTNASLDHAGLYAVTVANPLNTATTPPALLVVNMAPRITTSPLSQTLGLGTSTTLDVVALGSAPMTYQWRLQGTNLPGATGSSLPLGPVSANDAGYYSVVVENAFGAATSQVAVITVAGPTTASLAADDLQSFAGALIEVPIRLLGTGGENTATFSLGFDPTLFTYLAVSNGTALGTDASLLVNASLAAKGQVGLLIAQPAGQTFPAGTNHLATLHLKVATGLSSSTTAALTWTDTPIARSLLSPGVRPLPATYLDATVTLEAGLEGDVSPSPNGDGLVAVEDWMMVGLMVAGLASPAGDSQFVRADCAPIETRGDGRLGAADWTQTGRYLAGLDAPKLAGGPVAGSASLALAPTRPRPVLSGLTRRIEIDRATVVTGQPTTLRLRLLGVGNENTAAFTLVFDPRHLQFLQAIEGRDLGPEARLVLNTNRAAQGRLGVLLAKPAGTAFAPGTHDILAVRFTTAGLQPTTLGFNDEVIRRELVSTDVRPLIAEYPQSQVLVLGDSEGATSLPPVRQRHGSLLFRWNAPVPGRYRLEASSDFETWDPVTEWNVLAPGTLEFVEPAPDRTTHRFFRVR